MSPSPDDVLIVYVTAPSADVALDVARSAVAARLAACANVLAPIRSIYWWNGEIHTEEEVPMLLKTVTSQLAALTEHIVAAHPYTVPCVVGVAVVGGNPAFLHWVRAQTADAEGKR